MQDTNLNSGTPIFKTICELWLFLNNPILHAKSFHFKNQTHIEHLDAELNTPSAWNSLLLAKVSKITPPANANSCEFWNWG